MKKKLVMCFMLIIVFTLVGCNNDNKKSEYYNLNNNTDISKIVVNDTNSNNIIELMNIEKIVITYNMYNSVKIYIEDKLQINTLINILNSEKLITNDKVDYTMYSIDYNIDIVYKSKILPIRIMSSENKYYFIDNLTYISSNSSHLSLEKFLYDKIYEYYQSTNLPYIALN